MVKLCFISLLPTTINTKFSILQTAAILSYKTFHCILSSQAANEHIYKWFLTCGRPYLQIQDCFFTIVTLLNSIGVWPIK